MKKPKLDADAAYLLVNRIMPDGEDLAAFDVTYEISNGMLISNDTSEPAGPEAELVGIIGLAVLDDEYFIERAEGEDDDEALDIIGRIKTLILELPDAVVETAERDKDAPALPTGSPVTIAAMAAWRTPDGTTQFVTYHHPVVLPAHVSVILKRTVARFEAEDAGASKTDDIGDN